MWIIYALSASLLWGLTYTLDEQIYKYVSVTTSLAVASFVTFLATIAYSYFSGVLIQDITIVALSKRALWYVLFGVLTFLAAELFIGFSISHKNATLAGLIEISYPLFIAVFSYVLFREQQTSLATFIGGILIFFGVLIIYFFNR
jgi:drug/metabolite transporter (DMT)-like permease